jgi:hypothetical protein
MNKVSKFFRFLMLGALVCSVAACGKDNDEPVAPLIPAFVSVEASDVSLLLSGDAVSKEITVKANREVTATVDATWLTATVVSDLATSTAKVTLTPTKNEDAYKGRTAVVSLAAVATPGRTDDNVSSSSAKGSLDVKQSLFGLPTADLFDWKADAAGNVSDISPNAMPITVGPAKPVTVLNPAYGLYEATITEVSSEIYAADHPLYPGERYYYDTYSVGKVYIAADGSEQGFGSRRMSFYKIPWATNAGVLNAYRNAFSYELIYQAPENYDQAVLDGGVTYNSNQNLFGNINPTHCGFGIQRRNTNFDGVEKWHNAFCYFVEWGGSGTLIRQKDETGETDAQLDCSKYYHVIVTYDKSSNDELITLYVDGVRTGGSGEENLHKALHFPRDYYGGINGHQPDTPDNTGGGAEGRTANTEWMCIGGGSHQSGYPTFGSMHGTKIVVARLYGKALTKEEVAALYNYHKPE